MSTIKFSRQREAIKEYLQSTIEHPTADKVYMHIREEYPNVSLGTVYRNLNLLSERGEIIKVKCQDGCDRFDSNMNPHYHVVCNECGSVSDLFLDSIEHINVIAGAAYPGRIEGHVTYFHGVCPDCLQSE